MSLPTPTIEPQPAPELQLRLLLLRLGALHIEDNMMPKEGDLTPKEDLGSAEPPEIAFAISLSGVGDARFDPMCGRAPVVDRKYHLPP